MKYLEGTKSLETKQMPLSFCVFFPISCLSPSPTRSVNILPTIKVSFRDYNIFMVNELLFGISVDKIMLRNVPKLECIGCFCSYLIAKAASPIMGHFKYYLLRSWQTKRLFLIVLFLGIVPKRKDALHQILNFFLEKHPKTVFWILAWALISCK